MNQILFGNPTLIGKYKILEYLGHGSFGDVYKAQIEDKENFYSIKRISRTKLPDYKSYQRLNREIKVLSFLSHPNITRFIEVLTDESFFYIITEFCFGINLLEFARKTLNIDIDVIRYILKQILLALSYLHSVGICHRDLKLENIIISNNKNIKLIDFGLCGFDSPFSMRETFCGSHLYASPEILNSLPYHGYKSDIWSVGVILYALFFQKLPWSDNNIPQAINKIKSCIFIIPSNIDENAINLINFLLKKNPEDRPTVSQILKHPFFQNNNIIEPTLLNMKIPKQPVQQRFLMHWKTGSSNSLRNNNKGKSTILSSMTLISHSIPYNSNFKNSKVITSTNSHNSNLVLSI